MRKIELNEEDLTILSCYTGYMLIDKFDFVHEKFEKILGEPIYTHQFAFEPFMKELKEKIKPEYDNVIKKIEKQLKKHTNDKL